MILSSGYHAALVLMNRKTVVNLLKTGPINGPSKWKRSLSGPLSTWKAIDSQWLQSSVMQHW